MVRLYFASYRAIRGLVRAIQMAYCGFWLGILTRKQLHSIGERKYRKDRKYWTEEWNKGGLFDWEQQVVERDFAACRRVLIAAAGGGREVLALRRTGMEVDGFESDPGLLNVANELLEKEGLAPDLKGAPWDHCPAAVSKCDGVVVGWAAYMLIRGRDERIDFLRELRARVAEGSPILLSFMTRSERSRYFRYVARIGNILAAPLGRDRVDVGDTLLPNFAHRFTREQLEAEMMEGGFRMISYDGVPYGHAVGRAV